MVLEGGKCTAVCLQKEKHESFDPKNRSVKNEIVNNFFETRSLPVESYYVYFQNRLAGDNVEHPFPRFRATNLSVRRDGKWGTK